VRSRSTSARRGGAVRALFAFLLLLLASGCGGDGGTSATTATSTAAARTFANPVYDENFPDPFVLRVGDEYYAYGTNGENGNVPTLRSRDLVHWRQVGDAFPELGAWANEGKTWAPEVLRRRDGEFVLYYTAQSAEFLVQCIGRAVASAPAGPFVDSSKRPLVCQRAEGGSIDASPFVDGSSLYLLWKNDGNAVGRDTFIYAQRLAADGLSLVGRPARLVTQDAAWEGALVEAPTLWVSAGRYFLFFSANKFYDSTYAVGYARCERPLGPCEDAPENPILKTACDAVGPGHQSLVRTDDGDTWIVYHAWPPDAVNSEFPGRLMWIDRVEWKGGRPDVVGPTCASQPAP
jgi:beta-xylosidase